MKEIVWYEAYTLGDCEGKSISCIGKFSSKNDAMEYSKGKDGYGRTLDVIEKKMVIFDSVDDAIAYKSEQAVKAKKLTQEEIEYVKRFL